MSDDRILFFDELSRHGSGTVSPSELMVNELADSNIPLATKDLLPVYDSMTGPDWDYLARLWNTGAKAEVVMHQFKNFGRADLAERLQIALVSSTGITNLKEEE